MAEWRKVAKAFALEGAHITQKEVTVLRTQIFSDEHVSKSELDFLYEIKQEAISSVQLLDDLITDCEAAITQ